jgi:hypothetical protein
MNAAPREKLYPGDLGGNDASLSAAQLDETCSRHPGVAMLGAFNAHLAARALSRAELLLFLASMAAFNRHTIGGIAILAGRLSDEILPLLPRTGHEIGAYVLDAAVDEYGLRETRTHVELARNFAEYLGIDAREIETRSNACPAALTLGDALFSWYRKAPVGFALGVHIASEGTSVQEFIAWHDIFLKFPQYRFSLDTPQFEYLRAHYVHEPDHVDKSRSCMSQYLDVLPGQGKLLGEGAERYLEHYQEMFHELDTMIFK